MAPRHFFSRSVLVENATSRASSNVDDCAICLSQPKKPKTLPCGHVFCKKCIDDLVNSALHNSNCCPTCRAPLKPLSIETLLEQSRIHFEAARVLYLVTGPESANHAFKASIRALEQCLELDPNHLEALLQLANLVDDADRRVELYKRALQTTNRPLLEVRMKLAALLQRRETPEHLLQAVQEYKDTIVLAKGILGRHYRERCHMALGGIYSRQGDYVLASLEYEMALKVNPKNTLACSELASCQYHQGDYHKAAMYYQKALKQEPYNLRINLRLADIYEHLLILNDGIVWDNNSANLKLLDREAASKAYLGCVLRADSVAFEEDMEAIFHHMEQIETHFPTIWLMRSQNSFFQNSLRLQNFGPSSRQSSLLDILKMR